MSASKKKARQQQQGGSSSGISSRTSSGGGDSYIEWTASILSILCSVWRSLNVGFTGWVYLVSIISYAVFIAYSTKTSQKILNSFYILTSVIGVYRYGLNSTE